ncbi:MAG: hypothetical protein IPM39_27785 [Chloroflexi bacterium]|nr:hypothetical protein [Chloroflexota bacterium]
MRQAHNPIPDVITTIFFIACSPLPAVRQLFLAASGLLAVTVLGLIYATTLQRRHQQWQQPDYLLDTGIQVPAQSWGTVHYTGYPLTQF